PVHRRSVNIGLRMKLNTTMIVNRVSNEIWEIPPSEKSGMLVPARIYATQDILESMDEGVFEQVTNVACLPGIVRYALCMPDGHWGYGFPIGGVAAFDVESGVVSPGGVGYDVNCGMRLIRTDLMAADVRPRLEQLMTELFRLIPAGVGAGGFVRLDRKAFDSVMRDGARWCVAQGYGWHRDLEHIEEGGCVEGADPSRVSDHAVSRGINQLGTLGSGNHYLEVQVVSNERVFDPVTAAALGIAGHDQIVIMVHCGSRGFGHQVASDYLKVFEKAMRRYGISVKDQQLACAPFRTPEGQDYFAAMKCAANTAFANRQVITHQVRRAFASVFGRSAEELGMDLVYDVAHNIAKVERYEEGELLVHRKGSTRAFGPGRPELPGAFRETGQPVICGGSMETGSYLLVGTERAMRETFGSTMHGSGRTMSRAQAKKAIRGEQLQQQMKRQGILVKAVSMSGLAEEAGFAYKNISDVVETVERAGITKKVAELRPIGNIKG
ncbi:MAG TPA: RtcB family protein, partial [Nitrospira sp.]|nr:RtcB family protein [Nitrospira sp.]